MATTTVSATASRRPTIKPVHILLGAGAALAALFVGSKLLAKPAQIAPPAPQPQFPPAPQPQPQPQPQPAPTPQPGQPPGADQVLQQARNIAANALAQAAVDPAQRATIAANLQVYADNLRNVGYTQAADEVAAAAATVRAGGAPAPGPSAGPGLSAQVGDDVQVDRPFNGADVGLPGVTGAGFLMRVVAASGAGGPNDFLQGDVTTVLTPQGGVALQQPFRSQVQRFLVTRLYRNGQPVA